MLTKKQKRTYGQKTSYKVVVDVGEGGGGGWTRVDVSPYVVDLFFS